MISYEITSHPEFSAIQIQDGTIYHQRGEYLLNGETTYIPVNRSYRPALYEENCPVVQRDSYVYDKLINDSITEEDKLYSTEQRLKILGKSLLVIALGPEFKPRYVFSSRYNTQNLFISMPARKVLDKLSEDFGRHGYDIPLGVHGSHGVGLNGVDSDMDLIAWAPAEDRHNYLQAINNAFLRRGYVDANETSKFNEYSVRIANLTGLSPKAGAFLASQRNRWVSPNGVSTSLQLLDSAYTHHSAKLLIESALNNNVESLGRVVNYPLYVEESSQPFNYPRIWNATSDAEEFKIISFNMVHQGMGANTLKDGSRVGKQVMTAAKFRTADGSIVYCMQNHGDYILPMELAA